MQHIFGFLPNIILEQPLNVLYALPLLAALGASWAVSIYWRRISFRQYGDESLVSRFSDTPDIKREAWVIGAAALAVVLICLSAVKPYTPAAPVTVSAGSLHVMAAFDGSISMAAEDDRNDMQNFGGASCAGVAGPCGSRMEIAKAIMQTSLLPALTDNQVGLVVYSGDGVIKSYMTDDFDPLHSLLGDWHWVDVGSATGNGSYVAGGLKQALIAFDHDKVKMNSPGNIILLFTDGGHDDDPKDLKQVTDEIQKRGIKLIIIGVGATDNSTIPVYADDGTLTGYFPGTKPYLESARDDQFMQTLADDTGGQYIKAVPGQKLAINWPSVLAGSKVEVQKVYLYQYPLGLGMLVLCLVFFRHLPERLRSLTRLRTKRQS